MAHLGTRAALRIGVEVMLAQAIPVDRYGVAVYKMLRYFQVQTATPGHSSPFDNGPTTTTLDGVAVDTVPGVAGLKKAFRYDHRQWMADRAGLEQVGLPTCALRDKAREKAKFLNAYQSESTDMIKHLACKDELDTVATLFTAIPHPQAWFQASAWLLAEVAVECSIDRPID